MADSIAKLAVILTGDGAPLSAALQASLRDVDKWQLGMARAAEQARASWNAGLENISSANMQAQLAAPGGPMAAFDQSQLIPSSVLQMSGAVKGASQGFSILTGNAARYAAAAEMGSQATFRIATALSAARGNVAALANVGMTGGPAILALVGVAALVKFGIESARAADRAEVDASKIADAYEAAFEKLHGRKIDIGMNFADTLSGAKAQLEANMAAIGKPLAHIMAAATAGIARDIEQLTTILGMETAAQEKRRLDLLKQQTAEMNRQVEAREKAQKAAAEEAKRLGEELERQGREMESRAEALARSLRTPREEFVAALAEASQLFEAGFLSAQNYERAAAAAAEKFQEADKVRSRASQAANQGVAAAERHTAAGFSAQQQGQRQLEKLAELEKIGHKNQEKQIQKTEETNDILRKFKPAGVVVRSSIS